MPDDHQVRELLSLLAVNIGEGENAIAEMHSWGDDDFYGLVALQWLLPQAKKVQQRARRGDISVFKDGDAMGVTAALEAAVNTTIEYLEYLEAQIAREQNAIVKRLGLEPL